MKPILEPLLLGHEKTIDSFCYEASNFGTPWHFHPQHELTYIEESTGTKLIGDFVGPYAPGELVLLRGNLPHCWKNLAQEHTRAKSIVIQWNPTIFPKVPELQLVLNLLKKADKGIIFDTVHAKELLPFLKQLPTLSGHELYVKFLDLLTKLAGCSFKTLSERSFRDDLPSVYGNHMSAVHEFISENFNRKIYLREVAELVNMSEQSFSRFFSKMLGRPFFSFLNEYRINRASQMLLDSDYSVSQIGYACGYESLTFFHKQFKKFLGCTPKSYQKRYTEQ